MKVYSSINAITAELAKVGISKSRKNAQQGYQFRGIDDIYSALAHLLAENHLCILPRCIERVVSERETQKGGTLFYTVLKVEFDFVNAEDDSKHIVVAYGEAMDSGDKSTNKAMSAAYKYACLQTFCIPTEGDNDADSVTPEPVKAITPMAGAGDGLPAEIIAALDGIVREIIANIQTEGPEKTAVFIEDQHMDTDQKLYVWSKLDSKTRAALKKAMRPSKGGV